MSNNGLEGTWDDEWEGTSEDDEYMQSLLASQAERIRKLRTAVKTVRPKLRGRELLDSPMKSMYELSRVSATFRYLRLVDDAEIADSDFGEIPVIGELGADWAVDGKTRSDGRLAVMPATGTLVLWSEQAIDSIASSATSFREIFAAFAEYRSGVSKLDWDEYGPQPYSDDDDALHRELTRTFWIFGAQRDPSILASGSQFWSNIAGEAASWRD